MTLAAKLKELRLYHRLTQAEMAVKLDISKRQYIKFEREMIPTHTQLLKLNKIFHYDFSIFIYPRKQNPKIKEALERVKKMEIELTRLKHLLDG